MTRTGKCLIGVGVFVAGMSFGVVVWGFVLRLMGAL